VDISELAQRAQEAWLRGLAAGGFAQISTGDGFAVSTGLDSNTENGAVVGPSVLRSPRELDVLLDWLRAKAVPASVLLTGPPEPEATARLVDRGLHPERTGNNMGRLLTDTDVAGPPAPQWQISEVTDIRALRENQGVYAGDGWWAEPGELDHHVEVAARLGFGPGRPVRHWTALHQGVPVGAATSFRFGDAVLLVHCCVAASWRRRGIGTALTRVRLAAAARQGAVRAVLFPSPDGYELHRSLGFEPAPVHPDRCFYLF
jgi:GNAT superfamily N-acetyltransferase